APKHADGSLGNPGFRRPVSKAGPGRSRCCNCLFLFLLQERGSGILGDSVIPLLSSHIRFWRKQRCGSSPALCFCIPAEPVWRRSTASFHATASVASLRFLFAGPVHAPPQVPGCAAARASLLRLEKVVLSVLLRNCSRLRTAAVAHRWFVIPEPLHFTDFQCPGERVH
ncbi:MAG: hypothetical protein QOJ99_2021, partial [Bryobacterales bacterium]|nr:hypothetical protein [Bryobacterales bacterium]